MADTIIPKPDPNAAVTPTFEPAPVTTPAPTPNAVSPSAVGVAAPGVQPTPSSTAPAANGVAGVTTPNPTVAGNNAATQGKEAIQTLATPAPLPAEAQKTATPAAPTTQPGAAPVKPAAGASGSGAAGSTPAGGAGSTSKPGTGAPAAKGTNAAALDILAPANDAMKRMLEGDDPIAKIQYNQILTGTGPRNQAMLQNLGMKLKQANLDGQGAGSAMLAMLARDNEYNVDQLMANVSADSAKRLYDANVHGFDKAIEINQANETQRRADLAAALQNGQLGAAKDLFEQVYPGIPFDEAAAKAASPQATANFNSRMKLVDQFVSQGDATQAKAVFDKLAEDMPEMFGFPNDPAAAKAAMAGVDFTTEAWQNNLKAQNDASAAARTAALQGDQSALSSSIDQLFAKMTPAAVEGLATSAAKSRSLDEINKILAASGMAPVATTDEAQLLDKTKFAKAVKTYDLMQDSKKNVVDGLLDTFASADPAIAIDPAARTAAKAWLAMHAYGIATDPNGGVTNFTLDDKATPPWDPSSPQAYLFMDWPVASFNPDGTVAERSYNGMTPYSTEYKPGDTTTAKGREDARLDKAYEQYVFSTDPAERLDMNKWYFASQGGTKPADQKLLSGALKTPDPKDVKPTYDPANPADMDKVLLDYRKTNVLTPEMATFLNQSGQLKTTTAKSLASQGGSQTAAEALANTAQGGFTQLENGAIVKVLPEGGEYTHHFYDGDTLGGKQRRQYSYVAIEYNGQKYKVDNQGNWYPGDAKLVTTTNGKTYVPATIPDPTKAK